MPWTHEGWSAWIDRDRERAVADDHEHDRVVRTILGRLPGARQRTLALIAGERMPGRSLLAAQFGEVIELPHPGALRSVREPRSIDVALADMRDASRDELDSMLLRLWDRLSEGAPVILTLRAAARGERPTPLIPPAGTGALRSLAWHEVEVQYRLRRASFQGVRARRFRAASGPVIVAIAVRRAWN